MKVLMVTPYYYPIIGGTESLIENIALKLNEHNVHTDVLTFNYSSSKPMWQNENLIINGLTVKRIPVMRLSRPISFLNHVPGSFRSKLLDYDVIHFHNDVDLSFPLFSFNIPRKKIFHFHCLDTTYFDYRRNPLAKKILINSADCFIALSSFLAGYLLDLGISKDRIKILSNGINTDKFNLGALEKVSNLLLFVGRLDPKKGLPVLLAALKHVKRPVKLVIIGPPSTYEEYSASLIRLMVEVKGKTIHEIVYLGKVPVSELVNWYQKASVVILPSIYESFPMVPMEALACGTPVIASNVGAIPEVVRNHENGIIVQPNNPVELANAIEYLLDNESLRKKFGRAGREWVVQKFSSEITIRSLIQIYVSLMQMN